MLETAKACVIKQAVDELRDEGEIGFEFAWMNNFGDGVKALGSPDKHLALATERNVAVHFLQMQHPAGRDLVATDVQCVVQEAGVVEELPRRLRGDVKLPFILGHDVRQELLPADPPVAVGIDTHKQQVH